MELSAKHNALRCVIVTPEKALIDETCDFIAVPMYDGELGVLPGRLPVIGRLGFGELRTKKGEIVHRYFVDGGFVQIKNNVVTVLTSKAQKGVEINETQIASGIESAQKHVGEPGGQDLLLKAQERVRAQKRVARNANPEKVLSLEGH
ncbi:MAG: F0F1 ATP synthase subunit epsilon [Planctomycetota bacterium]